MSAASRTFYDQDVEDDWDEGDGIGDVIELFHAAFGDDVALVEREPFSANVAVPLLGRPNGDEPTWPERCWACVYDPDHDHGAPVVEMSPVVIA